MDKDNSNIDDLWNNFKNPPEAFHHYLDIIVTASQHNNAHYKAVDTIRKHALYRGAYDCFDDFLEDVDDLMWPPDD